MMDFEKARTKMVDCQIRPSDVTQYELIQAFMQVPREEFVPKNLKPLAYIDDDLSIGNGRFVTEPARLAQLLQLAKIDKDDIVLVVGAGCGYTSAIVSLLASSVVALEADSELATEADNRLSQLGYDNVAFIVGPHANGYPKEGPYDVIVVDGAVHEVPTILANQLSDGGRLVCVEGFGNTGQARVYSQVNGKIDSRNAMNCSIKPLPGFEKEAEFVF